MTFFADFRHGASPGCAGRLERLWRLGSPSIARRLFLSSALASVVVLTVAGLVLTALYRGDAQAALDDQLGVYMRALVADIALSRDEILGRRAARASPSSICPFPAGTGRSRGPTSRPPDIRASRSLFASRLPRLADSDAQPDQDGRRRGNVVGPDKKPLRMLESGPSTPGDQGRFLVQVAATTAKRGPAGDGIRDRPWRHFLRSGAAAGRRHGDPGSLRPASAAPVAARGGRGAARPGRKRFPAHFPREVAPLAEELNLLIAQNREIVERARIQVGNLAHALKTPLSVIVNEADAEESELARKVSGQAEVMRDQVKFYLDRARAATRAGAIGASADPAAALAAMARAFAKIYPAIDLAVDCPAGSAFSRRRPGFRRHGGQPDRQRLQMGARRGAGDGGAAGLGRGRAPVLPARSSTTTGRASPPTSAKRRLRRGRRLDESKPGSGLGLSIVADLAAAYGGRLALSDSPLGGLRALLILPALPQD